MQNLTIRLAFLDPSVLHNSLQNHLGMCLRAIKQDSVSWDLCKNELVSTNILPIQFRVERYTFDFQTPLFCFNTLKQYNTYYRDQVKIAVLKCSSTLRSDFKQGIHCSMFIDCNFLIQSAQFINYNVYSNYQLFKTNLGCLCQSWVLSGAFTIPVKILPLDLR